MRFAKLKVVPWVIRIMLVTIAIGLSLLLVRQNQIIENGTVGAGVGFGWVFYRYATLLSWMAAGWVFLPLLKRK